jgi:hypothetical protein
VAFQAIHYEKAKKKRVEEGVKVEKAFSQIEGLEPEY